MEDVTPERSRMMARIRAKNTKPEIQLRSALHSMGFRYRLHVRNMPGRPDLVMRRWNAAILVNGCFWHGHDCKDFKWPKTRQEFWREKITANRARDIRSVEALILNGWRVIIVWECALKRLTNPMPVATDVANWLKSESQFIELQGQV